MTQETRLCRAEAIELSEVTHLGWTSNDGGRENVTQRQRKPRTTVSGNTVTVLKHHRYRDQDWFLCEVRDPAGNFVSKSIQLTVWEGSSHKEMSATMHPDFYGCPVAWLDEVPEENAKWREAVRLLAGKGGGMNIGVEGRTPSPSPTCEEASCLSLTRYIACGHPATKQVYHPRDNRTLAMCDGCADHNVRNRRAQYVEVASDG